MQALSQQMVHLQLDLMQYTDRQFAQEVRPVEFREVTFKTKTAGVTNPEVREFPQRVGEILMDERGWRRSGVKFRAVDSGDAELEVVLAAPMQVGRIPGCSSALSCTFGNTVYLNSDRWFGNSPAYVNMGVSDADYQVMVLNHEVGHFLGFGHEEKCPTLQGKAPIMVPTPQSVGSCQPSYWPLPTEIARARH